METTFDPLEPLHFCLRGIMPYKDRDALGTAEAVVPRHQDYQAIRAVNFYYRPVFWQKWDRQTDTLGEG
jgi:hypothetical protein